MPLPFSGMFASKQPTQQQQMPQSTIQQNQPQSQPGQNQNQDPIGLQNNPQGAKQQQQEDPFQMYTGLFEPSDPTKQPKVPSFDLTDEVIGKAASGIDFTAGLPPELQERLDSGEALDSKTVLALMNHSNRNAYTKAMAHLSKLTDKFVNMHSDFSKQGLNKEVQRVLANNSLTKIPGANNPVVKGFLEITSNALASKYPDQTPEWVAEKTKELFLNMAKAMQDPDSQQPNKSDSRDLTQDEGFEWDKFLTAQVGEQSPKSLQ